MTRAKRISDKGLEHAIMETRRAVADIVQTLEFMDTKVNYLVESLRYYVPSGDTDGRPDEEPGYYE